MSFIRQLLRRLQVHRRGMGNSRSQVYRGRHLEVQRMERRRLLAGTAGDFDGDGYDDLAIGVPLENVDSGGDVVDAGAVNIIYGSDEGLDAAGNQLFHQDSPDMHGAAGAYDRFGFALASGDFNADGFYDLAIGVPYEDVGSVIDAGAVQVVYGSSEGLNPAGVPGIVFDSGIPENQLWYQDNIYKQGGGSEAGDRFGFALAGGDFDGDGYDDLAIGAPGEAVGNPTFAGAVTILYGSSSGLVGTSGQQWFQGGVVDGGAEAGDNFGFALAAGRFNNDSRDDLAIGIPFEDVSVTPEDGSTVDGTDSGAVQILYGSASGLSADGNRLFTQFDLGEQLEDGDRFGYALAVGNFDGQFGQDDLAIGVPYEDRSGPSPDAGMVHVIFGSAGGLDESNSQLVVPTDPLENSLFGYSLAAAEFGESSGPALSPTDLAIGAPWTTVGGAEGAGAVYVAYGSFGFLDMSGDLFAQGLEGISGVAEVDDLFGYSLVAGDFGRSSHADLAVGVPLENLDDSINAGAVHVVYGGQDGLGDGGNELWYQGSAGIIGSVESGDSFGCGLAGGSL